MKKIGLLALFAVALSFLMPAIAQAQQVSLRVEPGVAVPLGDPQDKRFDVGGDIMIKPEFSFLHYLSAGPSLGVMAFPSKIASIDSGVGWLLGGFLRIKRPHDELNTSQGFAALAPWIDADLQYVRTGSLNRFGWSVAIGAAAPVEKTRQLWIGPFLRYQSVYDPTHPGFDSTDAKVLVAGVSFDIEPKLKPTADKIAEIKWQHKEESKPEEPKPEAPKPVDSLKEMALELHQVIQFAWDSPVLDAKAQTQLKDVLATMDSQKSLGASYSDLRVEGHASSEGQVEHNNLLALKRAQSVVDFLVAHGVAKDKVVAVGFGSTIPVATNKTENGRVLNRRAEFTVKFTIIIRKRD